MGEKEKVVELARSIKGKMVGTFFRNKPEMSWTRISPDKKN